MRLASEDITVMVAGEPVTLHPSLRAALRLARRHNGFTGLALGVMHGRIEIMAELISEGSGSPETGQHFLFDVQHRGLGRSLAAVQVPLLDFIGALAGHDPDAPAAPATGTPMAPVAYLERLFGIATGWLGWAPADAWDATPAEIIAAKDGRTELITDILGAIFGTSEKPAPATPDSADRIRDIDARGFDPAFDRAALMGLRNRGSVR